MSTMGFMSGRLNREQAWLERLNQALLIVHASALGQQNRLGVTSAQVTQAREELVRFADQMNAALKAPDGEDSDLTAVVRRIDRGEVLKDWQEDFEKLSASLHASGVLGENDLTILRQALAYFRQHVAESLSRIRPR